eukprot:CAMPEP_0118719382 /NCGR_PEP_ID=MMETSP0800-20121206/29445_1 /TAXON_ID=210618 ORGANISM="Striatella unipunctata, Strain CCMP2910" /NCGR_SAMPLE_ID=MMETSP0800 /ASSEMBLY_ACC=CAM_ASM_000638 /LENGTH=58 /DNA_ID=CAMNT_0006626747 /DNA_START=73 /DNA_END=249 /DNA_ORIENTATION=-
MDFKNPLSSGLGKGGRMAAWAVAFAVVGVWTYYENKDNGRVLTTKERDMWNSAKKPKN